MATQKAKTPAKTSAKKTATVAKPKAPAKSGQGQRNTSTTISTTALAKALQMSARRLFGLLQDFAWIQRLDDHWELTAKGEQEQGAYRESKQYGRFIVWPAALVDHPLLRAAADAEHLTANGIGQHFKRPARIANRVLQELGWLRHSEQGWLVTELGEHQGGVQLHIESGKAYVSWPKSILANPALQATFDRLNSWRKHRSGKAPDLFETDTETTLAGRPAFESLDGHVLRCEIEIEVCQWLYLMGIVHACRRELAGHAEFQADFYLPQQGIYIDILTSAANANTLAKRLARQQWCQQQQLTLVELSSRDVQELDKVLSERLGELGIHVYA